MYPQLKFELHVANNQFSDKFNRAVDFVIKPPPTVCWRPIVLLLSIIMWRKVPLYSGGEKNHTGKKFTQT